MYIAPSLTDKKYIMTYDDYLELEEKRKNDCWEEHSYNLTFVVEFLKDGKKEFDFVDAYDCDEAFNKTYEKFGLKLYDVVVIAIFDDYEMNPTTFSGIDVNEL